MRNIWYKSPSPRRRLTFQISTLYHRRCPLPCADSSLLTIPYNQSYLVQMATGTPSRNRFRRAVVCLTSIMRLRKRSTRPLNDRRKKAMIIGTNYSHNAAWVLKGPMNDVKKGEKVLLDVFGFQADEITILSDDGEEGCKATQANIMKGLEEFVIENEANVDYTFIFTGHSHQFPARDPENGEEDGLSECILPCDAVQVGDDDVPIEEKVIFDYDLKKLLVKRLGPGSQLVAMFDSCHSATLLNLKHHKCNRLRRWTSPVRHICRRYICDPFGRSLIRVSNLSGGLWIPYRFTKPEYEKITSYQGPDEKGMCTGFCCGSQRSQMSRVYCISACKDKEMIFEDPDGRSMVDSIFQLLERNPTPTFRQLMTAAHKGAQKICDGAKEWGAAEAGKGCSMLTRHIRSAAARQAIKRWNPEISSTVPLNMDATLILCELPSSPPIVNPRSLPV